MRIDLIVRVNEVAKPMPEQELKAIEAVVSAHPEGIAIQDIQRALEGEVVLRTFQYRLKHLVDEGRLVKEGMRRWVRYLPSPDEHEGKVLGVPEEELAGGVPKNIAKSIMQGPLKKDWII